MSWGRFKLQELSSGKEQFHSLLQQHIKRDARVPTPLKFPRWEFFEAVLAHSVISVLFICTPKMSIGVSQFTKILIPISRAFKSHQRCWQIRPKANREWKINPMLSAKNFIVSSTSLFFW
jgi:hypothetical protein